MPDVPKILIVEDDATIASAIASELSRWGFEAAVTEDFAHIIENYLLIDPALVLLDISLPFYNGFFWCAKIREISKTPIIFISSRADDMDIVMAMNMGGDDYVTKPFSLEVLLAKVRAVLRRSGALSESSAATSAFSGATLNPARSELVKNGVVAELTKNELKIMSLLLQNKNAIVSREKLMSALWESGDFVDDNTLAVNVNRLRKKLAALGLENAIKTCRAQGYMLDEN